MWGAPRRPKKNHSVKEKFSIHQFGGQALRIGGQVLNFQFKIFVLGVLFLDLLLQTIFRYSNFGLANRGVSLGLGQGWGNIFSITAFGIVCIYLFRFRLIGRNGRRCFILLFLGGIGNMVSRLIWGSVWDYICLSFLPFCFNLSDVLISFGVVSYILGVNGNRSALRRRRNVGNK